MTNTVRDRLIAEAKALLTHHDSAVQLLAAGTIAYLILPGESRDELELEVVRLRQLVRELHLARDEAPAMRVRSQDDDDEHPGAFVPKLQ